MDNPELIKNVTKVDYRKFMCTERSVYLPVHESNTLCLLYNFSYYIIAVLGNAI